MSTFKRILVIRYGGLGDFILTLPLLAALRRFFPEAAVTFMGNRDTASLANGSYIDILEPAERHGINTFFVEGGDLDASLSDFFASFDLILSFRTDRDGIFAANIRRACRGLVVSSPPAPDRPGIHTADFLLSSLDATGADWRSFVTPEPLLPLEGGQKDNLVAIHPGSGSSSKCWPLDRFVEIARRLERETGLKPSFILGPAEADMRRTIGWHFSAYDNRDIHEVAAFLKGCRAYVGNDSGVTHLAAALGVPTLALFGPTDPLVWGPRGGDARVLKGQADCAPCTETERHLCRAHVCLESLAVEEVFNSLLALAQGSPQSP